MTEYIRVSGMAKAKVEIEEMGGKETKTSNAGASSGCRSTFEYARTSSPLRSDSGIQASKISRSDAPGGRTRAINPGMLSLAEGVGCT